MNNVKRFKFTRWCPCLKSCSRNGAAIVYSPLSNNSINNGIIAAIQLPHYRQSTHVYRFDLITFSDIFQIYQIQTHVSCGGMMHVCIVQYSYNMYALFNKTFIVRFPLQSSTRIIEFRRFLYINSQPILIKFYTHYCLFMSWPPWKFRGVLKSFVEVSPFDK